MKDVISGKISSLIASGVLAVGDELPGERDLAAALSVSRETVRGAIQTLAARGIVDVAQGTRTRVANADFSGMAVGITGRLDINSYDVHSVHGARLLIEQQVVGDAAERVSDETLALLRRALDVQAACLDDPVHFLICDREFHVAIYRECGNPLLADIVTDLYTHIMDHRRRAMSFPGAMDESFADHRAIVAALAVRDRKAAMAAFAAHEERIYASSRRLLGDAACGTQDDVPLSRQPANGGNDK